ncbi:hypothetical protein CPB86DRAFT_703949 [Serendipita vermifera]|nr:hypothetical protein CPB86DRAFT_703949 [Serendipita vermifera]
MQLFLKGSPLSELTVTKADGSVVFTVETHPYLEDQRTEVYDVDGDVLGSILWNGTQPSHICVYSESATHAQPFEMVPRGDPTSEDHFEVVAGDGAHEMLWVVDRTGLRAHYPMYSRTSVQRPPLVADFFPKKMASKGTNTPPTKRKFSEADCDVLELAVEELSDDALGRFWVAFVLLDIIRKSKFRIPDEPLARLQSRASSNHRYPKTAGRTGWRSGTEKLKDLTIGLMLQPRRWSL